MISIINERCLSAAAIERCVCVCVCVCVFVCVCVSAREAEWADVDNMLMILLLHFLHDSSQCDPAHSVWAHTHTLTISFKA